MAGIFFCGSSGSIQEHLLTNYKDNNASLTANGSVTDSFKFNPFKALYVVISESNHCFVLHTSLTSSFSSSYRPTSVF